MGFAFVLAVWLTFYSCLQLLSEMGVGNEKNSGWLLVFFIWTPGPSSLPISAYLGEERIFSKEEQELIINKNCPHYSPSLYYILRVIAVFSFNEQEYLYIFMKEIKINLILVKNKYINRAIILTNQFSLFIFSDIFL